MGRCDPLKNQLALGTVNAGPDAFSGAIADLARFESRWPGALAQLITHRHAPEDAPALLKEGLKGGIKHVLEFSGPEGRGAASGWSSPRAPGP